MVEPTIHELAKKAVEDELKASDFVNSNMSYIYQRLIRCHNHALESQKLGGEFAFFSECRPLIDAVISLGSNLYNYRKAKKFVVERFNIRRADPGVNLSILILIYLVERIKNYRRLRDSAKETLDVDQATWDRIKDALEQAPREVYLEGFEEATQVEKDKELTKIWTQIYAKVRKLELEAE